MKKIIQGTIVTFVSCILIAACGGGNGNGAPGYTHNELAANFVSNLNANPGYSVTMAKRSTEKANFIVIYDAAYDSYDAINIDNYVPNSDAAAYYENNANRFFYDLDVIPGYYEYDTRWDGFCECWETYNHWVETTYRDRHSGFIFEKVTASSKDLEKMAAFKEVHAINQSAKTIEAKFGLSAERSKDVAKLAIAWEKAGGKDLTEADQDAFSEELLGFSITDAMSAAQDFAEGDTASLDELLEVAAETNGTSPEHIRSIMTDYFVESMMK